MGLVALREGWWYLGWGWGYLRRVWWHLGWVWWYLGWVWWYLGWVWRYLGWVGDTWDGFGDIGDAVRGRWWHALGPTWPLCPGLKRGLCLRINHFPEDLEYDHDSAEYLLLSPPLSSLCHLIVTSLSPQCHHDSAEYLLRE
ncbi:hypothetical protein DV515_00018857 [Chloebia gouldiae]|uniref:Uncharacterized protein n=1 Tax=Chloebia gouldiae TaxID=44316 RepID=A0A3L8Q6T6_CHLGU|nr:hypothetical protein DV515_00018857 [Chloebia gouldiae]